MLLHALFSFLVYRYFLLTDWGAHLFCLVEGVLCDPLPHVPTLKVKTRFVRALDQMWGRALRPLPEICAFLLSLNQRLIVVLRSTAAMVWLGRCTLRHSSVLLKP